MGESPRVGAGLGGGGIKTDSGAGTQGGTLRGAD